MEDMEVEAGLLNKSIQGLMQELRGKGDNVQLLTGEVEAQREMAQRRDEKIAGLEVRGGRGGEREREGGWRGGRGRRSGRWLSGGMRRSPT